MNGFTHSDLYAHDLSFMTDRDWERYMRLDRITKGYSDWRVKLLEDFKEWSGGFTPGECEEGQVRKYIELAMPSKSPEGAEDFILAEHRKYISET